MFINKKSVKLCLLSILSSKFQNLKTWHWYKIYSVKININI